MRDQSHCPYTWRVDMDEAQWVAGALDCSASTHYDPLPAEALLIPLSDGIAFDDNEKPYVALSTNYDSSGFSLYLLMWCPLWFG